jgi:site-specific recombinase XerC
MFLIVDSLFRISSSFFAKEMIGHSDISMTDRYSHLSVNHVLRRQDRLAEHYNEGLSN